MSPKIDGDYLIQFISRGKWVAPTTPEGPFPDWVDVSTFQTNGDGYYLGEGKYRYIIGENIESQYNKYEEGFVEISDNGNGITLDATLSHKYSDAVNHSGTYKELNLKTPKVYGIEEFKSQEDMVGKYIKANGIFQEFRFLTDKYVFEDRHVSFVAGPGRDRWNKKLKYSVIGYIDHYYEKANSK